MMSRMADADIELKRLCGLDAAVRNYLAHLAAVEEGSDQDEFLLEFWRGELETLTVGSLAHELFGDEYDFYGFAKEDFDG